MDEDYLFNRQPDQPLGPNETRTKIIDEVHVDEKFGKAYLNRKDVVRVAYYNSISKSIFNINPDDDAIDGKIFLNVVSSPAERQFALSKSNILFANNSNKSQRLNRKFNAKTTLKVNEEILVKIDQPYQSWECAKVLEFKKETREVVAELLYIKSKEDCRLSLPFYNVAYHVSPFANITKALRVIAKIYREDNITFQSGRIIELAKKANNFRYLVFFEDGQAAYVSPKDVSVVLDQTRIHENFGSYQREFLAFYFKNYPEIPTPKFHVGDKHQIRIKYSDSNGDTYVNTRATVIGLDFKLVQFKANFQEMSVWLYRGDFTLIPSIDTPRMSDKHAQRLRPIRNVGSYHNVIEITIDDEDETQELSDIEDDDNEAVEEIRKDKEVDLLKEQIENEQQQKDEQRKLLATDRRSIEVSDRVRERDVSPPLISDADHLSRLLEEFKMHDCSNKCLTKKESEGFKSLYGISIYVQPIYLGWKRLQEYNFSFKKTIIYLTPCGIKLFDLETIFDYLQKTKSILQIDQFNFDPNFTLHMPELDGDFHYVYIKDISKGLEKNQPVSLINNGDKNRADDFEYTAERVYDKNVSICQDKNFLVCCNCEDDCRDADNCACQRLTISIAVEFQDINKNTVKNRILNGKVVTGIYECNQGCACKKKERQCINRNGQFGLRIKLQVFKTARKGN